MELYCQVEEKGFVHDLLGTGSPRELRVYQDDGMCSL